MVDGADLTVWSPQMAYAASVVDRVFQAWGEVPRLTSAYRPRRPGDSLSLHSQGKAGDWGLREMGNPGDAIDGIIEELREELGADFDVVDERAKPGQPHIHIEYDPKR